MQGKSEQEKDGDAEFHAAFRVFRKLLQAMLKTNLGLVRFALDELQSEYNDALNAQQGSGFKVAANDGAEEDPDGCTTGQFAVFALAYVHQNRGVRPPLVIKAFNNASLSVGNDYACGTRLRRLGDNEGGDCLIQRDKGKRSAPLTITDSGRNLLHALLTASHPDLPERELEAFLPRLEAIYAGITKLSNDLRKAHKSQGTAG